MKLVEIQTAKKRKYAAATSTGENLKLVLPTKFLVGS